MPQGSFAEKELKRQVVATAVIAGEPTKTIARKLGCSRRYVRHLAAAPETRFLIVEVFRPYHAVLRELAGKVISVIKEGLDAMKTDEADHDVRLRAVDRYLELLRLAEGQPRGRRRR